MRALILAAGKGSRLGGAGGGLPKPLVPVRGRPVLERNVAWVASAGVADVWVNLHAGADAIRKALGDGSRFGVRLHFSYEPDLLGTAGAWLKLRDEWDDTSLVIYGDNYMRFDLDAFLAEHRRNGATGTVALFDPAVHAHTAAGGGQARLDVSGRILEFREGGEADEERPVVNAGAYLLEPEAAQFMAEGFLDFGHDVLPGMAAAGRLAGHVLEPGSWCLGIDTPERLRLAESLGASLEASA
jgi:mannose-1-phosphate guanylyltransferase